MPAGAAAFVVAVALCTTSSLAAASSPPAATPKARPPAALRVPPVAAPTARSEDGAFAAFAARTLEALRDFEPARGGGTRWRLPGRGRDALAEETRRVAAALVDLLAFEGKLLSEESRLDRLLLESHLRGRQLELEEIRPWNQDPVVYDVSGALLPRLSAGDAAGADALLAGIPALLESARENLTEVPLARIAPAADTFRVSAEAIERAIARAFPEASEMRIRARAAAEGHRILARHLDRVLGPTAKGDAALGEDALRRRLQYGDFVDVPVDRMIQVADLELRRVQAVLFAAADRIAAGESVVEVARRVAAETVPVASVRTEAMAVGEALGVVLGLPPADRPAVEIAPATPAEGEFGVLLWRRERADGTSELRLIERDRGKGESDLSRAELKLWVAREGGTGAAYAAAAQRRVAAPVRRALPSGMVLAGFAHMAEESAREAGWGAGEAMLEFACTRASVREAARCAAYLRLHTRGMSVAGAEAFLRREAFLARPEAAREAASLLSDHTAPLATLGKVQLRKMQADSAAKARREGRPADAFAVRRAIGAQGALPARLLRQWMGLAGPTL